MFCEVELCIYNKDYECTSDVVEIESSGRCYQRMTITVPKEALESIKKEQLKKEKEQWKRRLCDG